MTRRALIIGGTSGLGQCLARRLHEQGYHVGITGRRQPNDCIGDFQPLSINADTAQLSLDVDRVMNDFGETTLLVYNAGFRQRGHIDQFEDQDLMAIANIGITAPMLFLQRLKRASNSAPDVIIVTSSSQIKARKNEPSYCATKAGLGMLGASIALDPGFGRVLVAAPAGLKTPFWDGEVVDTTTMLDPGWVATVILEHYRKVLDFGFIRFLRNPPRYEFASSFSAGV